MIFSAIPGFVATGGGNDSKGRIGTVLADMSANVELRASLNLHILEILVIFTRQMAAKRIFGFVNMAVGIIDGIGKRARFLRDVHCFDNCHVNLLLYQFQTRVLDRLSLGP